MRCVSANEERADAYGCLEHLLSKLIWLGFIQSNETSNHHGTLPFDFVVLIFKVIFFFFVFFCCFMKDHILTLRSIESIIALTVMHTVALHH